MQCNKMSDGYCIDIMLTELCNVKCTHCYMRADSSTNKITITKTQLDALIDNLPPNPKRIIFTGGEVYMKKDLLYYALSQVQKKFINNKELSIRIETNGMFFYQSPQTIIEEAKRLISYGVDVIRLSDDEFHAAGGVDLEKVRLIGKVLQEGGLSIRASYLIQNKALPIGRGEGLEEEKRESKKCMNYPSTIYKPYLFTDIGGNLYVCSWKCVPPIGNIILEEWKAICKRLYDPIQTALLCGNIQEAVKLYISQFNSSFRYEEALDIIYRFGECIACNKIFNSPSGLSTGKKQINY